MRARSRLLRAAFAASILLAGAAVAAAQDARELYDALAYDLRLEVDPDARRLAGRVTVTARALAPLDVVELDLAAELEVRAVFAAEVPLAFERRGPRLVCRLAQTVPEGERFELAVDYAGSPRARDGFTGFHWRETRGGEPWIGTSCQLIGAHSWWPCKASFFHPEDKPDRVSLAVVVPADLVAVSNGRREGVETLDDGRRRYRWRHDYPLPTYSLTLNVGPYVEERVDLDREVAGIDSFAYWVLPENAAKARVQFAEVPRLVEVFSEAFGPFPFPDSKLAFVETSFWGMEHSTAIAYGSSYPAWIAQHGGSDRYAHANRWFDYILVHEFAHEWWGNSVTAHSWSDFAVHEGFGTYAEGVYVERTQGRAAADRFFGELRGRVGPRARVWRAVSESAGLAYSDDAYNKGALYLNTLRHFVDDDDVWWAVLREFHARHRHGSASLDDFRTLLEERTERDWRRFFEQFVYGEGYPRVTGAVRALRDAVSVSVKNSGSGDTEFHVPLDLEWIADDGPQRVRLEVPPGGLDVELPSRGRPRELRVVHLARVLGRHGIGVR